MIEEKGTVVSNTKVGGHEIKVIKYDTGFYRAAIDGIGTGPQARTEFMAVAKFASAILSSAFEFTGSDKKPSFAKAVTLIKSNQEERHVLYPFCDLSGIVLSERVKIQVCWGVHEAKFEGISTCGVGRDDMSAIGDLLENIILEFNIHMGGFGINTSSFDGVRLKDVLSYMREMHV